MNGSPCAGAADFYLLPGGTPLHHEMVLQPGDLITGGRAATAVIWEGAMLWRSKGLLVLLPSPGVSAPLSRPEADGIAGDRWGFRWVVTPLEASPAGGLERSTGRQPTEERQGALPALARFGRLPAERV